MDITEKLKAMISVSAAVIREGAQSEVPLKELVPGDVVKLSAGDMIPADVSLVESKDLFITQATLTGESLPVEKFTSPELRTATLLACLAGNAGGIRHAYSSGKDVVDPQIVDVASRILVE